MWILARRIDPVVLIGLVVLAPVLLGGAAREDRGGCWARGLSAWTPSRDSSRSARDILDQRYARGEIDTADYEERRSKLG